MAQTELPQKLIDAARALAAGNLKPVQSMPHQTVLYGEFSKEFVAYCEEVDRLLTRWDEPTATGREIIEQLASGTCAEDAADEIMCARH